MPQTDDIEALLERCAEEEIHIPGTIQPHGTLIAVDPERGTCEYAAANVEHYLGPPADEVLGQDTEALFGSRWEAIRALAESDHGGRSFAAGDSFERDVWISAHLHNGWLILEIEADRDGEMDSRRLARMQERLLEADRIEEILELGVQHLADITGYEHVMAYRFRENWDGEVVAEAVGDRLPSYLGHRFPASDIPKQARELYRESRFRMIPDAQYEPVPLLGRPDDPLDLSFALLRSVSPVHLRYLENMEVRASCSISILADQDLWGLFACHDPEPALVSPGRRFAATLYGRQLSAHLSLRLRARRQEYLSRHSAVVRMPHGFLAEERSLLDHLEAHADQLMELAGATGWVARVHDRQVSAGVTPSSEEIDRLFDWLDRREIDESWSTRHLAGTYDRGDRIADRASGLLTLELPGPGGQRMVFLRPAVVETVTWAGDPSKQIIEDEEGLSPRSSFEAWTEQVENRSEAWEDTVLQALGEFRSHLVEAIAAEVHRRKNRQLDVVHRMLRHDIRNKAGVVRGYGEMLTGRVGERLSDDDPKAARYLRRIVTVSRDIIEMTRSAWALSEAIQKSGQIEAESVDLREVLAGPVGEIRDQFGGKAEIRLDLPDERDGSIEVMGGGLLDSVFLNLIENAVEHHDDPPAQVAISVEVEEEVVRIRVADDGPGVPEQVRRTVFEESWKGPESEGTGMGLFIVRLIVEEYGGSVWVEENEPRGSIFVIELARP